MTNRLPKYWVVKNTRTAQYSAVAEYLAKVYGENWGVSYNYYGFDGSSTFNGTNGYHTISEFKNCPEELTLQEFIDLTTEWTPKRGELVEVSEGGTSSSWKKRIYLATIEGAHSPFQVVHSIDHDTYASGKPFAIVNWKRIRRIEEPKPELKISITLNGKAVDPSTMSEETWNNLRLQSNPTC